jgi:hypothetical protein
MGKKDKPKSFPILCDKHGEWKDKLEKCLQTDERITLLALGNVKFDVLRHIRGRKDIEIVKLETRYMKRREKGMGLKLTVRHKERRTDDRGPNL